MSDTNKRDILTPKERQERNRQETMNTILDVAQDLMREDGVAALNLQVLAKRMGMRAPSLYNYFPNKLAIYEAIFERGMQQVREDTAATIKEHGATIDGQGIAITRYMTFALENPELFQLLFERPIPGFVPSEAGLAEGLKLQELGGEAMELLRQAGGLDESISNENARDLFIALMHGLTALHLANEPHLPVGEGRFGSLIPLAVRALELVYQHGMSDESHNFDR